MNSFVKVLIQPILEAEGQKGIALIPGGFKPPTIGHFALVDEVAKNSNFEKVIVLIGHKNRDGVSKEESKEIWDILRTKNSIICTFHTGSYRLINLFLAKNKMRNANF